MSPSLIILSLLTILITYNIIFYRLRRLKVPPGPRPLPIVGNVLNFKPPLVRCFTEWAQKYGPIFSVYFGPHLSIVVSSVALAKEVLKDNDHLLADRSRTPVLNKTSKNGMDMIWSDYGPHYVKVRKLCTLELFSTKRVEALRPIREDEVTAMVESIYNDCIRPENDGKQLVLRKYLGAMSFLHITRLTFGKRLIDSNGTFTEQGEELRSILEDSTKSSKRSYRDLLPRLPFLFKADNEELDNIARRSDNFTKVIMEECALARKDTGNSKSHFVDALLTLQEEYQLSEDTVIGLLWDMVLAGMDTTSITLEWGMAEIVRNARVQQKIQQELHHVIGTDRVITEADIPNLPYLQCVVKECLRMHPPTPLLLPHKASVNVNIGGYYVPKGTTVNVNAWAIARDPVLWKDPLAFRPERFQAEAEDVDMKGTDFRLFPFGSGRRVCPGAQLATNLVTSALGHMLHSFSWRLPQGVGAEDVDMMEQQGLVTYMQTPFEAVPIPRLEAHLFSRVTAGNV